MKKTSFLIIIFILAFSFNAKADHYHEEPISDTLEVYSEGNFPPFNYTNENDEVVGISAEIINEILKDAKFKHTKTKSMPWARSYEIVKNNANTAVFSTFRAEYRENLFTWVGPIYTSDIILLVKKGKVLTNDSNIVAVRNSADMNTAIAKGYSNIVKVSDNNIAFKLLDMGRVDAWAVSNDVALKIIKNNNLNPDDYITNKLLASYGLYITLNKHTNKRIQQFFLEKFSELEKNGFLQATLNKYGLYKK